MNRLTAGINLVNRFLLVVVVALVPLMLETTPGSGRRHLGSWLVACFAASLVGPHLVSTFHVLVRCAILLLRRRRIRSVMIGSGRRSPVITVGSVTFRLGSVGAGSLVQYSPPLDVSGEGAFGAYPRRALFVSAVVLLAVAFRVSGAVQVLCAVSGATALVGVATSPGSTRTIVVPAPVVRLYMHLLGVSPEVAKRLKQSSDQGAPADLIDAFDGAGASLCTCPEHTANRLGLRVQAYGRAGQFLRAVACIDAEPTVDAARDRADALLSAEISGETTLDAEDREAAAAALAGGEATAALVHGQALAHLARDRPDLAVQVLRHVPLDGVDPIDAASVRATYAIALVRTGERELAREALASAACRSPFHAAAERALGDVLDLPC